MAALSFVSMRVSKSICEKKNFFLVQSFLKLEVTVFTCPGDTRLVSSISDTRLSIHVRIEGNSINFIDLRRFIPKSTLGLVRNEKENAVR